MLGIVLRRFRWIGYNPRLRHGGRVCMSLELCILGSGSGGNCSVLRSPSGAMLIDAGLGPRTVARRLNGTGVRLDDVRAICLTHLDSDHFSIAWLKSILSRGIRLFVHSQRMNDLLYVATRNTE